jgi:hypothetical protein
MEISPKAIREYLNEWRTTKDIMRTFKLTEYQVMNLKTKYRSEWNVKGNTHQRMFRNKVLTRKKKVNIDFILEEMKKPCIIKEPLTVGNCDINCIDF